MSTASFFDRRGGDILRKWVSLVLASYPEQTVRFLRREKDRFRNPAGHVLREGLPVLFKTLREEGSLGSEGKEALEAIVRLRAVQGFTPSQALSFLFSLKALVHEEAVSEAEEAPSAADLRAFEERVDAMALAAFDLYAACRERLHEAKAKEAERRVFLLEKAAGHFVDPKRDSRPRGPEKPGTHNEG